jgi:hypothetical protein
LVLCGRRAKNAKGFLGHCTARGVAERGMSVDLLELLASVFGVLVCVDFLGAF